jgi:hypothetical protein
MAGHRPAAAQACRLTGITRPAKLSGAATIPANSKVASITNPPLLDNGIEDAKNRKPSKESVSDLSHRPMGAFPNLALKLAYLGSTMCGIHYGLNGLRVQLPGSAYGSLIWPRPPFQFGPLALFSSRQRIS